VLIYSHRWAGIAGCLLFVAWFASGIVMMYARMPSVNFAQRLATATAIDLSQATISPSDAVTRYRLNPDRLLIGMLDSRPVYRFFSNGVSTSIFADSGEPLAGFSGAQAIDLAAKLMHVEPKSLQYEELMTDSDQWTLGGSMIARMPMHRIAVDDGAGTVVYVSGRTGEITMLTDSRSRLWGYLGPVIHYIYFTPLRRQAGLWNNTVIGLSFAGCLACLSGIAIGVWRFSFRGPRFRRHGSRFRSPYMGLMRWHHYAGLIFGLTSFTWILSGGLSLNPFDWHSGTSPTKEQQAGFRGGPIHWDEVTLPRLHEALATVRRTGADVKEADITQVLGRPYLLVHSGNGGAGGQLVIPIQAPEKPVTRTLDDSSIAAAAESAMPGTSILDQSLLTNYDSYYYTRLPSSDHPLPVWRIRFADAKATWLYADPHRGVIVQRQDRRTRWNRWLYHGLHSLDFPFLYNRRPHWDIVVIALSIGGLIGTLVVLVPSWRRLRRHASTALRLK